MSVKHNLLKLFSILAILAILFSNTQPPIASAQGGGDGDGRKVSAAGGDGINRKINAKSGKVSFIGPESGRSVAAAQALGTSIRPQDPAMALAKRFAPEFGVKDPARDLVEMKSHRGDNGRLSVRYQQKYQGIPVMGGELIVNTDNRGNLYSMNGEVSADLSVPTQPTIDMATAQATALQAVAKSYQKNPDDFVATEPALWIYDESLLKESTRPVELVWRMDVTAKDTGMPVRELVLVNAQSGDVSLHFNQIDTEWKNDKKADDGPTSTPEPPQPTEPPVATDTPESVAPQEEQAAAELTSGQSANFTGNIYYVTTTGNDTSNSCSTTGAPCATINGAISKAASGDTILVATGSYTGSGTEVVLINKNITLSGGWDTSFTSQSSMSTIDGQNARRGVYLNSNIVTASLDHFIVLHAYYGLVGVGISNTGTLTVNNSTIQDSTGGGISNNYGNLTLNNTIVKNNTSGGDGSGIYNSGNLILNNVTVSNNSVSDSLRKGGGIYNFGNVTLNNSTISNNRTYYTGGGISSIAGSLDINNSTISENVASYGGGISVTGGTALLQNTIVADNTAWYQSPDCRGSVASLGYNLIGDNSYCSFSAGTGDLVGTTSNPISPRLAPLQNYGGFTPIYALMAGSPAINAGNPAIPGSGEDACLSTDQRGVTRPQSGRCDIGAFEHRANGVMPAYIIAYGDPQYIAKGETSSTNLKASVLDSNGDGVSGVTVTFTAPGSGPSAVFSSTGTNTVSVLTDAEGLATAPSFSVNNIGGGYVIRATVIGLVGSADFPIVNMGQIKTYTANRTSALPGTLLCDETNDNCTNNADPHADAAHRYAIGTYNLYGSQFGRNSVDNAGMAITSTVHYCEYDPYYGYDVCPYDNAFWSGTQMIYGDAHGYPLADDVVAHELTHGVTQYESNLFYYYQSGAINESLSDVFGEYYDQTNGLGNDNPTPPYGVKWSIGEDISGLGALRSMSNPPDHHDPDKMSSLNYFTGGDDNGGVHKNSGVNNKAVYLMVDGAPFNGKTITGIGWEKVGAIYYEVNTNLLTSASDYSDLYYAVQQACTNLIGTKGITVSDCAQVRNALDAVEMNRRQNFGNLDDPSFEYSYQVDYPYWYQTSTNFDTPLCVTEVCGNSASTAGPRTGSVWGWFGGTTASEVGTLSQTMYFPRGYPNLKLKFYLWIGRANAGSDANDKFMAQVDGVTVFTANATQKSSYASYRLVSVDLNGFATNALHTITFKSITSGQVVNFNLDDVSLGDNTLQISGNAGVADATLQYFASGVQKVTADASGNYSIFVPFNWTGTVTPSKSGYVFTPASRSYSNVRSNQVNQDYTAEVCVTCADINVKIGSGSQGSYTLPSGQSIVQSYSGVAGGPVVVQNTTGAPILASMLELRRSDLTVNQWTGIAQVMGMQLENLSDKTVFPRYTNIDASKYEVIPIANFETFDTHVTVKVGNTIYGPYLVSAGTSYIFNQAIQGGPVLVSSDNSARIVASLYQLKRAGTTGRWNGQSEMMGIPLTQLSSTYVLPYYNYTTPGLLPSINIANADTIATDITVSIGTSFSRTYPAVAAGTSQVVSYSGKAGGPVVVKSSNGAKIIASMLELRRSNLTVNQWTGIAQVMGMQLENLSDKTVFPRYTNIDLTKYEVIPIANYETFDTNVTVKVGNSDYGPYLVAAGTSFIFNQAIEGGPVLVSSDNAARIVASLYQLKRAGTTGAWNGQSEMMGIPFVQLSSTYVLPYYDYTTPGLLPSLNIAVP